MKRQMIVLRIAVFPLFAAVIVWLNRHFVRDNRSVKWATLCSVLTAACGEFSVVVSNGLPHDLNSAANFAVLSCLDLLLACALWVAIYAGVLLGKKQGGYWIKGGDTPKVSGSILLCIFAAGILAFLTGIASSIFGLAMPRISGGHAILTVTIIKITYSLAEEFFYRGCFQALLKFWFGPSNAGTWCANGVTAVLFAAQHVSQGHQSLIFFLALIAGLSFGSIFFRFGVLAAVGVHLMTNLLLAFLMPWVF